MLKIIVDAKEHFNEETMEFENHGGFELELEHSLISLSKWEAKHKKPFLSVGERTANETFSYVECMIVTPIYPHDVLEKLSSENLDTIQKYIESSESATTFGVMPEHKGRGETITSELVYYWLVAFTIPFEVERWHLNRLFALIRICNLKNSKQKKMSRHEIAQRNRDLNAQRRAELGSSG